MGAVQRKMNLRIISGWRTLSRDAANVISGVPPIRLLALERKEIWVEQDEYRWRQEHLREEERNIIDRAVLSACNALRFYVKNLE